jgi:glycerate kinase
MNILVAPNSFKECANSIEISEIINSLLETKTLHKVILKPLSDGGDGFLQVIKSLYRVTPIVYNIYDSNNDLYRDFYVFLDKSNKNVFIESAELFGLKVINDSNRKPLKLNTAVLGDILINLVKDVEANKYEIEKVLIGIGGTATIDFGIGACSRLRIQLLDNQGKLLYPIPENFSAVKRIKFKKLKLPFKIKCIVDVETELIGEPGAIEVYGKQKGATENDLKIINDGINNILHLISVDQNSIIPDKLNGAGGGLAAGLNIFLDSEIIPAEDFIKNIIFNDLNLNEIDAVITGEGCFDYQSFEGKGSGVILKLFQDKPVSMFLINGSTNLPHEIHLPENVYIINLTELFGSKEESIKNYRAGIAKAAHIIINKLNN